jgi:hypothetical protein
MGDAKWVPGSSPMPPDARRAALATFARIIRERHPGVSVLPLAGVGPDRPVVESPAREVIRPFAAPEERDALLDRAAGVAAPDDHRVD